MPKDHTIRIGNIHITFARDNLGFDWEIAPAYRPFFASGKADIHFRLHHGVFDAGFEERIFDCPPIWALYRQNGNSIIKIAPDLECLRRTLVLSPLIQNADLYFDDEAGGFMDPFYGPTMEILMVNYLAQGKGCIVHACGIAREGKGLLFVGESGAGKSTIANLWDQETGVDILSDDRILVRKKGRHYWMYGTPWHGEAKFATPKAVRLEKIFFLRHGPTNAIGKTKGIDRVSQLLTGSFPPYWDAQGMAFTMALFSDLTHHVPCHELTFKPDKSALDLVMKMVF